MDLLAFNWSENRLHLLVIIRPNYTETKYTYAVTLQFITLIYGGYN